MQTTHSDSVVHVMNILCKSYEQQWHLQHRQSGTESYLTTLAPCWLLSTQISLVI